MAVNCLRRFRRDVSCSVGLLIEARRLSLMAAAHAEQQVSEHRTSTHVLHYDSVRTASAATRASGITASDSIREPFCSRPTSVPRCASRGDCVCVVGEWDGDTAERTFTAQLLAGFRLVDRCALPNWTDTAHELTVWERRSEASAEVCQRRGCRIATILHAHLIWVSCIQSTSHTLRSCSLTVEWAHARALTFDNVSASFVADTPNLRLHPGESLTGLAAHRCRQKSCSWLAAPAAVRRLMKGGAVNRTRCCGAAAGAERQPTARRLAGAAFLFLIPHSLDWTLP